MQDECTPLLRAVARDNDELVRELLAKGANAAAQKGVIRPCRFCSGAGVVPVPEDFTTEMCQCFLWNRHRDRIAGLHSGMVSLEDHGLMQAFMAPRVVLQIPLHDPNLVRTYVYVWCIWRRRLCWNGPSLKTTLLICCG